MRVKERLALATCAAAAMLVLCGCHKAVSAPAEAADDAAKPGGAAEHEAGAKETKGKAADSEGPEEGVTLKPEEVQKLGIVTTEAQAISSEPEVPGFGVVLAHDSIAQLVADLHTAVAAEHQSRSAFARAHRLSGTPGAMPADTQETTERQAATDRVALELAKQRLSSTLGQNLPWKNPESSSELQALASGQTKLVRVSFPLGSLGDATPMNFSLAHIDFAPGGKRWQSGPPWRAPADATVPGKSFFAVLKGGDSSEGDHLLAWAPVGAPESGVLVPASAVVISAGKFWCYIEEKTGTFVRTEVDPGRPTADGYFVKEGISAGDLIVTAAAGQLLARETNPSTEAE